MNFKILLSDLVEYVFFFNFLVPYCDCEVKSFSFCWYFLLLLLLHFFFIQSKFFLFLALVFFFSTISSLKFSNKLKTLFQNLNLHRDLCICYWEDWKFSLFKIKFKFIRSKLIKYLIFEIIKFVRALYTNDAIDRL